MRLPRGDQDSLIFTTTTWNTAQTVTVSAAEDDDAAADTETLTHTATGGNYGSVTKDVTVNVTDNDAVELVVTGSPVAVNEGSDANYTVKLSSLPSGRVKVTVGGWSGTDVTVDTDAVAAGDQDSLIFTDHRLEHGADGDRHSGRGRRCGQ